MTKRFGAHRVFEDLNIEIKSESFQVIVGPSGSGKSTLLSILARLQESDCGSITLNGADLTERMARSHIAWVPQGNNVLQHRSVLENAELGALSAPIGERRERAKAAVQSVGLGGMIDQRAKTLSGGELQRLAVARAMASRRPLIFADEPTGNLDSANTQLVVEVLRRVGSIGTCLVVATHDPAVVSAADAVFDMTSV